MDPRLPRAFAAMAAMVPEGADDATASRFTAQAMVVAAQLLKAPDGLHSIQSGRWLSPATRERDRLMCAVPVGVALSTIDPEAFAKTVWFACGCTTRDEFQSAALLAAAVSLALDSYAAPAGEAVEFVASLSPRGEAEEGPDVLTATRRAMNVLSNSKWVRYWSPINLLRQKLAAHPSSSLVIPLSFYIPPLSYRSSIASEIAELSGDPQLCTVISSILSPLNGRGFSARLRKQAHTNEHSGFDPMRIAGQLLELRPPASAAWLSRAAGRSGPQYHQSGPTSFEEPHSTVCTRFAAFEPESKPTPLGPSRGDAPAGRIVFMTELTLRYDRQSADDPLPSGDEWATREGVHIDFAFTAMCAARAMGLEVISLSPIGEGPRASIIADALAHEGIIDAGPRVTGYDNGYRSYVIGTYRGDKLSFIENVPEHAWDEAIRSLGPSDILFVDGSLERSPAVLAVAENAAVQLPEHARVIIDSSRGGVGPHQLPNDNVLMALSQSNVQGLCEPIVSDRSAFDASKDPDHSASFVQNLFERYALISTDSHESYLARPLLEKTSEVAHISRFRAPTVESTHPEGSIAVHYGVLAAGLALGYPIERCILLANCAGALASTMPGPASCPTREEIEATAEALEARADEE